MSEFRVDTITDRAGNGRPNFPNGLNIAGNNVISNSPVWNESGTAPTSLATENRIIAYNKGGKNILINGNMNIHQRSGSLVTGISNTSYNTADRWLIEDSMDTAILSQIVDATDFPTNTEFRKSLKTNCTTSKATNLLSPNDTLKIVQRIEGQNLQVLKKGTSSAESVTVSFWVKSNLTGTFICELDDTQNSKQVSKAYTINSSNTWEFKTITFPPDTNVDGTLNNDNLSRLQISFWLVAGANFNVNNGTLNSSAWASYTNNTRAVGQVNFVSSNTNSFWITGIQMEIGSITNPFEYRSYGEELILCQRYYQRFNSFGQSYFLVGHVWSTTLCQYSYLPKVDMRDHPTISSGGTISNLSGQTAVTVSSLTLDGVGFYDAGKQMKINGSMSSSSFTSGYSCALLINSNGAFIAFNSELL